MRRKPCKIAAGAPAFRTLALSAAVYLLPQVAAAQIVGSPITPTGSWLVTTPVQCFVFAPSYIKIEAPVTATWSGSCSPPYDKASGMGTLIVTAHGKVERYDGPMVDGMANGEGTLKAQDNMTYTGHFKDGVPSGYGVMASPNGARLEGTWTAGFLNGPSVEILKDGGRYQGMVVNDKRSGHGTMVDPSGARYVGEWQDDLQNGEGIVTFPNGGRHEGHWLNGKRDGHGVELLPSGVRYEGEFRDNLADGQGTMTKPDGTTYTGIWHHGCFHQGTQRASLGTKPADCAKE